MALFNDPAELLYSIQDWRLLPNYERAVDVLGIDDPDWRERLVANLHAIALEYRAYQQKHPSTSNIRSAVEKIASALRDIDQCLEVLLAARITAPANAPDRQAVLLTLYPSIYEILFPDRKPPNWDERVPGQAPSRAEYTHRGQRVLALADKLVLDELELQNRPLDPAFDRLIQRLAAMFKDVTNIDPYASHDGNNPSYRSPFAEFVRAVSPSLVDPEPGIQRIHDALARVSLLPPE